MEEKTLKQGEPEFEALLSSLLNLTKPELDRYSFKDRHGFWQTDYLGYEADQLAFRALSTSLAEWPMRVDFCASLSELLRSDPAADLVERWDGWDCAYQEFTEWLEDLAEEFRDKLVEEEDNATT